MQRVTPPYAWAVPAFIAIALVSVGVGTYGQVSGSGNLAFAGLVGATLFSLLALGAFVISRTIRRALAAMQAGDVFGSWEVAGKRGEPRRIDVGPGLVVDDGAFRLFVGFTQRAAGVAVDAAEARLIIRAISNDGNGDYRFEIDLPYEERDEAVVRACAEKIAERYQVPLEDAQPSS